jgi:hypothetical protein
MQKWQNETYLKNNMRLMRRHIGLLVLYILFSAWVMSVLWNGKNLLLPVALVIPIVLHSLLAYGSYKSMEMSRKASVAVFVLLAIGAMPVGTIISIFFLLPTTQWKAPENIQ